MQRARRLAATAVVAVVAVSGLSACRTQPGVAAYVGSTTISEARVQRIYDEAGAKFDKLIDNLRAQRAANPDPSQQPIPDVVELRLKQADVVQALVGVQVLRGIAQQRHVSATPAPAQSVAESYGLPADTEYIALLAEYQGYLQALQSGTKPAELTDDQRHDVWQRLRSARNPGDAAMSYEEFSQQVLTPENVDVLRKSYGLRADLQDAAKKVHITVNPRYGPQELPLLPVPTQQGGSVSLVGLPVGDDAGGGPAVVDLS
jgi:hypothetical protein